MMEEQMERIRLALAEISDAAAELRDTYGTRIVLLTMNPNTNGYKTLILRCGIDNLAAALDAKVTVQDGGIPPITRKECEWCGITIEQFPKKIREVYE